MKVTVMTPTYNRELLLDRLYNSLLRQNNYDFEWLIIDDGSSDNTKKYIEDRQKENKINIRYIYQKNSGKAAAFNKGIENASGDLFICVDSDDFLADNAIEIIISNEKKINREDIAGILALKKDIEGHMLGNKLPDIQYIDTFSLSERERCNGEWTLIYKTSILKKFFFPIVKGEKFVTENVLYDNIAKNYKMLLMNEVITICEYQNDGYTGNLIANMLKNPTGYQIYYMQRIDMTYSLKKRLGYIVRYNTFRLLSNNNDYKYHGEYTLLTDLMRFTGVIGKIYYNRMMKKHETK